MIIEHTMHLMFMHPNGCECEVRECLLEPMCQQAHDVVPRPCYLTSLNAMPSVNCAEGHSPQLGVVVFGALLNVLAVLRRDEY